MAQHQALDNTTRQIPLLSYIVVAHNHGQCIRRCLDSILSQQMSFPYEIVVGDDRSTDDTWAILEEYKDKYPDIFTIYRVNSDDCNPLSSSDRASYNRGHAYRLIKGKYYAEVDGDDYLLPGDTYQKQVELLETHPDCWLCMQNMSIVEGKESSDGLSGTVFSAARKWFPDNKLKNMQIVTAENYLSHPDLFSQHQSFVYRRHRDSSPIDLLGLDYEDTTATLFHLQFGDIIYLNQSGYQYISYPQGINRQLSDDDRLVQLALLPLVHTYYFPQFTYPILSAAIPELNHLLKITVGQRLQLSSGARHTLARYKGFLFRYYSRESHNIVEQCRIRIARHLLMLINRHQWASPVWTKISERVLL